MLVAYIFDAFQVADEADDETTIKVRFAFDLFTRRMLTPDNFLIIMRDFGQSAEAAAQVLVNAFTIPGILIEPFCSHSWSVNETILLLAGAAFCPDQNLEPYLPHRPGQKTWAKRVKRVIEDLWRPEPSSHQSIDSTNAPCTCPTPPDGRKMNETLKYRHLHLSNSLTKLKQTMRTQNARHAKEIQSITWKLHQLESENADTEPDETIDLDQSQALLQECTELLPLRKQGRRYSNLLYEIGELLRATSRKTYRILRQLLPLPCESCLFQRYGEIIRTYKAELTDPDMLERRIQTLISGLGQGNTATLGIDAFSFQTFAEHTICDSQRVQEYSNAFLFTFIPLDSSLPVHVIHMYKKQNGAYDDVVELLFQRIKKICGESDSPLWFKATDGDRYLSHEHELFFTQHVEEHRNDYHLLIDTLHAKLCSGLTMPIADPLHFAKNLRGNLIDHRVALVDSEVIVLLVDAATLEKVLKLGDALTDRSQLGRMRDFYVTKLFSLQNVCKLLDSKNYAGALALLPYACVFTVLYATNLSLSARVFFIQLAYECFNKLLTEAVNLVAKWPCVKHRFSSGCLAISIAEPTYIRRMMHTCLALGISQIFGPRNLRLAALGTHTIENAIGIARSISNSTKYESICSAFATAELRKQLAEKHGIRLHIPKRVNDGGAKIDTLSGHGIELPETWDPRDIASTFVECCREATRQAAEEEMVQFAAELSLIRLKLDVKELCETSEVANALIVQRNYKFKSSDLAESDTSE